MPKEGTDFGTSGNRFAFTSHRFDTELDLYYAGGRMYSPTIGRFISQDTLSLDPNNPDTWNLFSYARGNPTRYVDPTGHESFRQWMFGHGEDSYAKAFGKAVLYALERSQLGTLGRQAHSGRAV